MTRNRFVGLALATIFALAADQAWAGHHWGSCGSCGGSYGSWGSSGGSYGSWGSYGGSYGSCGSSGGGWYGSSGGSWGSSGGWYGSSGSSGGSYGSYGSSGGGVYYGGGYAGAPAPAVIAQRDNRVRFALTVPEDAKIYLASQPTTVTGTVRRFVTPELTPGHEYHYPIRVEVVRNGTTYAANSEVRIRAGDNVTLAFAAPANANTSQIADARTH